MTARVRARAAVALAVVGVSGLVTWGAPAAAQETPPPAPATIDVLATQTLDTGLVQYLVSLPPEVGARDVPTSAFTVLQGASSRPVSVTRLPNEDLDVVLVIDVSGSMAGAAMEAARQAALTFVREIPADARIGVVAFGDTAQSVAPLGSDPDSLAAAISQLEPAGETALFDALALAGSVLGEGGAIDARRTIVILSDGDDTVSTIDSAAAIDAVNNVDARVFAVALRTNDFDPAVLADVAAATEGRLIQADDADALGQLYSGIASTLSNEYVIAFEPLSSGPTEVSLVVSHLGVIATATASFEPPAAVPQATPRQLAAPTVRDAAPSPLTATVGTEVPFVQTTAGRTLGVALMAGAVAIIGYLLVAPERRRSQLARSAASRHMERPTISGLRSGAERLADRVLARGGRGRLVANALERAGLAMRPAEFVMMAGLAGIAAALIGFLLGGAVVAVVLFALVVMGARAWVSRTAAIRRDRFATQLPGTLQLMAGSLRTGYALPQVIETIARETESPTADEFHRIMTESRLGRDVALSLRAAAERMRCPDFDWVVRAVEIHREVGGDLAEVLGNVAATIRDRNSLRRTVQALSADGRMSAAVIIALPVVALVVLPIVNPEYVDVLFEETVGRALLGLAVGLIIVGWLWVRRLIRLEF